MCGDIALVTIDGPAGSGKTTLAAALQARVINSQVIAMDTLYNGWSGALEPELWNRIEQQILQPLSLGQATQYAAFNWNSSAFDSSVAIQQTDVVFLEGVGASHPKVRTFSSLNLWISAPEDMLLDRVLKRDGDHIREHMVEWQVAERKYFTQFQIEAHADVHLTGN
jgi:uridine kinase